MSWGELRKVASADRELYEPGYGVDQLVYRTFARVLEYNRRKAKQRKLHYVF